MKKNFQLEFHEVSSSELVVYGDFLVPNADPRIYAEINDFTQVIILINLFS